MRVIFLSRNADVGSSMLSFLYKQPCEVVYSYMGGKPIAELPPFPEYDLGIGYLYAQRIPQSELKTPYKWVNFHPAPLPEYRGRNVAYRAIMDKADGFGATIHYMDAGFDTGEIIECVEIPILIHYNAGDLVNLAYKELARLFEKWLPQLLKGKVPSTPQPSRQHHSPKPPIEDMVEITPKQALSIRALTVHPQHHAIVMAGGRRYKIVPED